MNGPRKLKCLSIGEKFNLIKELEKGQLSKKEVAKKFDIKPSTLSGILKNKEDVLKAFETESPSRKRKRGAEYDDIEEALIVWFEQARQNNIPISGPIIQEKALSYAKLFNNHQFQASDGWLHNFKKRHGIAFRKLCGESADVSNDICDEWKSKLSTITSAYKSDEIYNADETALFFKCLPDKTLAFKKETCHGGKNNKQRITLLLAVNSTGTDKLTPFVIGRSAKPRCLKGIKNLPVEYHANQKAWMNSMLISQWLINLNKKMKLAKRNILLFIDNCSAHKIIPELSNIKIQFLPANTTFILQPLDQGIIKNFKSFYRKEIINQILLDIESDGKPTTSIYFTPSG
ncbi:tigger transposable element-derived protein 6-like [Trichogramma pretiosum]|uniref:tigger transposable element-derived protein 6-like n=1 Tax=Trichogramma pretiosum TaxID=7493 RepID=UPI000C71BD1E|nr:tigger transposable element-derived protein 6-like [Trichogramma pretiosum]